MSARKLGKKMGKKMTTKSRPKTASKNLSWQQKGETLLADYLKRTGAPKGRIVVLSTYGDLVLKSSQTQNVSDWTSIGSLCASVQSASTILHSLLKTAGSFIQVGDSKKGFWIEALSGRWILLASSVAYKPQALKPLYAHLRKMANSRKSETGSEALDGLSEMSIEATLSRETQQ
jgi:hypothetical protein